MTRRESARPKHVVRNERELALDFIERAVDFGFINLPRLSQHEPFLENIRGEPRFTRLMGRVRRQWEAFEPLALAVCNVGST